MYSCGKLCLHCTNGGVEGRATVESEPTKPNEDSTEEYQGSVVWLAVRWLASTLALAQHKSVGQACPTRGNVNGSTSSIVKGRKVEEPSVGIPCPAGNWTINDGGPEEGEDQARKNAATLEGATDHDLHCACAEKQLVETEDDFGDVGVTRRWCYHDVPHTKVGHVTDESRGSPGVGQSVSPEHPLKCCHCYNHNRLEEQ